MSSSFPHDWEKLDPIECRSPQPLIGHEISRCASRLTKAVEVKLASAMDLLKAMIDSERHMQQTESSLLPRRSS